MSLPEEVEIPPEWKWRVGNKLGRTIYFGDICHGMLDTRAIAERVVAAMNEVGPLRERAEKAEARVAELERWWNNLRAHVCTGCGEPVHKCDCSDALREKLYGPGPASLDHVSEPQHASKHATSKCIASGSLYTSLDDQDPSDVQDTARDRNALGCCFKEHALGEPCDVEGVVDYIISGAAYRTNEAPNDFVVGDRVVTGLAGIGSEHGSIVGFRTPEVADILLLNGNRAHLHVRSLRQLSDPRPQDTPLGTCAYCSAAKAGHATLERGCTCPLNEDDPRVGLHASCHPHRGWALVVNGHGYPMPEASARELERLLRAPLGDDGMFRPAQRTDYPTTADKTPKGDGQ
jgi:hypothetical protein